MSVNAQKVLLGKMEPARTDRREHLRAYLLSCVRDNVLTRADLVSLKTIDKLRQTMTDDMKAMVFDAGAGLLTLASMFVGSRK